ncbi:MAG: hypothetical protein ORN56_00250 [Chitinophagales bacterium]|nr:hypothetical protein [Chitinophagales bacterium]
MNQKVNAQIDSSQFKANHIAYTHELDSLVDKEGNKIALEDLAVGHKLGDESKYTSQLLCTSGYFNLWFEQGCGMDGNSAIEVARRNVLCRVFYDLSQLINLPTGTIVRVNIWVRDIHMIIPNPCTAGILGGATSFYPIPLGINTSGIADNLIWQTINSGTDAYTNITAPLTSIGGGIGAGFYHGLVAFNFDNCNSWFPNTTWTPPLGNPTSGTQYDLYTVCLHEVVHALGFATLIDANGFSRFGSGLNYFSRYDLFLKTSISTGNNSLITSTGNCSMYNYAFNTGIAGGSSILNPGCATGYPPNSSTCSNAIRYVSPSNPSQPVYTPNCFESGSSLGHFEDMCSNAPSTYTPVNDGYFTMSNANGAGTIKRYLKEEEKDVLCDIGYVLSNNYGNNLQVANSAVTYTASCSGNKVVGINDGIIGGGAYQFIGTAGGAAATFSGATILSNDYDGYATMPYNPSNFECLQDITDPFAVISNSFGTNTTNVSVTSTILGQHLLRYIPLDITTGNRGNITYIILYFKSGNCIGSPCDIVTNGGFENVKNLGGATGVACSQISATIINNADCWINLSNTYDCYSSLNTCPNSDNAYPAVYFSPSTCSTTVYPTANISNKIFIGLGGWYDNNNNPASSNGNYYFEAIQNQLNTPLIPGQQYVLKMMVKAGNKNNHFSNLVLRVFASQYILSQVSNFITTYFNQSSTPDIAKTILVPSTTVVGAPTYWTSVNVTFTCPSIPSGGNLNYITIVTDFQQTANLPGNTPFGTSASAYVYIDDVSIEPLNSAITLILPATINCTTNSIPDLSIYLSTPMPGGVFSGAGVSLSGGIFNYNPALAGPGFHIISYTYTDQIGCNHTISDNIMGGQITPINVSFSHIPGAYEPLLCTGTSSALTATISGGSGSFSFAWSSPCGVITNITNTLTSSSILYINNSVPCVYTLTVTDNITGCIISKPYTIANLSTLVFSTATSTNTLPTILSGTTILVYANTTLTVNSNFNLNNCNVILGANAIIDIQPGFTLDIDNISHLHACSTMWNGINVNNNATVKLHGLSIIEQAIIGINSISGGAYLIDNGIMYNNYIHIQVNNYTSTHTGVIKQSTFDGHYNITNLLPPFNTLSQTFKSIYIIDNFCVTIGVPSFGLGNNITNNDYGVFINNNVPANTNKTYIYNNTITNANQIGIYDSSATSSLNNKFLTVGNTTSKAPFQNTISNCLFGIRSVRTINTICNNDISSGLRAITCRFNYNKPQKICNNDIHFPREVGISMEYSTQNISDVAGTQSVDYNNIWMSSTGVPCNITVITLPGGGAFPTKQCNLQTAIRHLDITANYNGRFQINNNNIYQPDRGIYISGGNHDLISNNTINLPSPYVMGRVEGILTSVSTYIAAQYNTVNKPSWANPGCVSGYSNNCISVGLSFFNSTNSLAQCNTTNFTSRGFESNNTTTNTYYKGNIMNTNEVGWWRMNNSFIGHQGTATNCWGNQWTGGLYSPNRPQTLTFTTPISIIVSPTSLINTNIYVPTTAPFSFHHNPTNERHDLASSSTYFKEAKSSNIIYSCTGNGTGTPTTPLFNYNENGYISYAELVASDALQYPEYPEEARYYDVEHLLVAIREDATLLQNDLIDSFYMRTEDESVNQFLDVQTNITGGELQDAGQILDNIVPDGIIEENRRQVYEIYLNTIAIENDEFTDDQRRILLQIAFQCPYTGGNAVMEARNMLSLTDSTNYHDSLLCGENFAYRQGSHQSTIKAIKHLNESGNFLSVYPNPSNSIAFIKWNLPTECRNCTFKIVNVLGELIKEQKGLSEKGKLEISTSNLQPGIYHCLLITNGAVTQSKKLIIIK